MLLTKTRYPAVLAACILGLFLLASSPAAADSRLILSFETKVYKMSVHEDTKASKLHYWLGEDRINFDLGPRATMIIRFDQKKLYWIQHGKKVYEVFDLPFDLPFDLRSNVSADELKALNGFLEEFVPEVEVNRTEEVQETEQWGQAKLTRLEVSYPGLSNGFTLDLWVSKEVPFDYELYNRGLELRQAIVPGREAWRKRLGTLDGFTVEFTETERTGFYEVVTHATLESVEEIEPHEGLYEPPPGYREISADYSQFLP